MQAIQKEEENPEEMSEEATPQTSTKPLKMTDINCKRLEYTIAVPLDKFDLDDFRVGIHANPETLRERRVCNTKNPEVADYHVHFGWRIRKGKADIEFEIGYVASPQKPEPDEAEPFAEDLMPWLGKYFKFGDASATIMAEFLFKEDKRQTVFPLPIKTRIAEIGVDAEINGVMFDLPSHPDGMKSVFIRQREGMLFLGIQSEKRIELSSFSVSRELESVREITEKFVR